MGRISGVADDLWQSLPSVVSVSEGVALRSQHSAGPIKSSAFPSGL